MEKVFKLAEKLGKLVNADLLVKAVNETMVKLEDCDKKELKAEFVKKFKKFGIMAASLSVGEMLFLVILYKYVGKQLFTSKLLAALFSYLGLCAASIPARRAFNKHWAGKFDDISKKAKVFGGKLMSA